MNTETGFSLKTQLYSLVVSIAVVAFAGSLWISIDTTSEYLNEQMESHAQDTATSLGLSISPYMDGESMVIVETMIAAIFDAGYYELLTLSDSDNNLLLSRSNEVLLDDVPDWFIQLFPLNAPVMTTEVNNGWLIAGILSVKSHPGTSYRKLWKHAKNNLFYSLIICLIALFIAHLILRAVLDPLVKVERQARAVGKKHFPIIADQPKTRELSTVIKAMNTMVSNIHTSFDQMSNHAEKLGKDVFIDELTGLGNRRAFENAFNAESRDMNSSDRASLGLVQLPSLQEMNIELGLIAGDEYVCLAADIIQQQLKAHGTAKLYRCGGSSFFFMIKNTGTDVLALCEMLHEQFKSLNSAGYTNGFAEIIATSFTGQDNVSSLLARLDTLLTQERSQTNENLIYTDHDTGPSHGLHEWAALIDQLITTNEVMFMFQPIKSLKNDDVLFFELFSQFFANESVIGNNQLYSMAERLNKSAELDKLVLQQLTRIVNFVPKAKIAINLTHQSFHDIGFRRWLSQLFSDHSKTLPALVFEVNENAVLASIDSSIEFIKMAKKWNFEVCIERFGSSFTSFKYLKSLDIDYLKIDGAYIHDLERHPENNHFIQAITQIGHGVGIKVLTTHVETELSLGLLKELHCDGAQGNIIQKPMPLSQNTTQNVGIYSPTQLF